MLELDVEGTILSKGRGRKTWNEWVKIDMKKLGLLKEDDLIGISGGVWILGTIQHCLSAVKKVWFFMDSFIHNVKRLITLNANDDDLKTKLFSVFMDSFIHNVKRLITLNVNDDDLMTKLFSVLWHLKF